MTQEDFKTTVLTADEGMYLTQTAPADISETVIATTVALGRNDSADNWKEITAEEAAELRAAIEANAEAGRECAAESETPTDTEEGDTEEYQPII